MRRRYLLFALAAIFILNPVDPAWAINFMVKPMSIELKARPGEAVETTIQLSNTNDVKPETIDLTIAYVRQGDNGGFTPVEPEDENLTESLKNRSCVPWLKLNATSITVPPLQTGNAILRVEVPAWAKGSGAAMVLAQSRAPEIKSGVGIAVRFAISVTVDVVGPSARKSVAIADAGLTFVPARITTEAKEAAPQKDLAFVRIHNDGETLAKIAGEVVLSREAGKSWRRVTQFKYTEVRALPGSEFNLVKESPRPLPTGKYLLEAKLTFDGRPIKPYRQEIEYAGDPLVKDVASDVEIVVDPIHLELDGVPGAQRSGYITLRNPGTDVLSLTVSVLQPAALKGVAMGEILGDHFSAHDWVTFLPETFKLLPGAEKRARAQASYPAEGLDKPYYYATLKYEAAYADGQPGGSMESLVIVKNRTVEPAPNCIPMGVKFSESEKNSYIVTASFGNVGDMQFNTSCSGVLQNVSGTQTLQKLEMEGPVGLTLPLSLPEYNGLIDVANLQPANYKVVLALDYLDKKAVQETFVRITRENNWNTLEVIER